MKQKLSELFEKPADEMNRFARLLTHQMRLWIMVLRQFGQDHAVTVAGDLTYKTLLSLIPLLVIIILMVNFFSSDQEVGSNVLKGIFSVLNIDSIQMTVDGKNVDATDRVNEMVQAVRSRMSTAAAVGLFFLFFVAIDVLSTMEKAMNRIWKATRKRGLKKKLIMFWLVLTLGPILLTMAQSLSGHITEMAKGSPDWLSSSVGFLIDLAAVWGFLALVYSLMPNTKVNLRAALIASMVAGTLWHLVAKKAFALYISQAVSYQKVYGSIAVIPLFFLWIWLTWLVVLFGCEMAYVIQHFKDLSQKAVRYRNQKTTKLHPGYLGLLVLSECARRFSAGLRGIPVAEISNLFDTPPEPLNAVLETLEKKNYLVRAGSEPASEYSEIYMPGTDPASIRAMEVLDSLSGELSVDAVATSQSVRQFMQILKEGATHLAANTSIADLARISNGLDKTQNPPPETGRALPL